MAGKVFNKLLDMIGLEETVIEEEDEEMMDEEYYEEEEQEPVRPARNTHRDKGGKVLPMPQQPSSNAMKMLVYQPMSYEDTQSIIDNLKMKKPIIVNLELLEVDIAQRVLDFMSGAVYALNGSIHKVSKGIFVLAPINVDISGNIPEENKGRSNSSFFSLANKREG
ncbi:cell division protein SepF [Christensenellaceae bacterium NSJ-44]|jgi:cell division inhibitor SepF|uniref:Cell division protein SepF n=1 Tax=Luoshenia tenuis TaxID=2763654 RepID=A0A926CXZ5_9FIRM|nr:MULTISPECIES: cell division protein SepF [Clostridia]MBC8528760.1 cell division protein SepF [Luoshenia tenuis]SCJ75984.1 Cell division protein SepF [uncultured Clostridium sp.]